MRAGWWGTTWALAAAIGPWAMAQPGPTPGTVDPAATPEERTPDSRDQVFYHFMPIAWRDSDRDEFRDGDFNGMTDSLDYLADLGVTAVWMNPIFPSPAYHGYQHFAPDRVDPRLGAEGDFWRFVNAAHARGIRVHLDLVAYGVNREDVFFQSARGNPASPHDSWLAFTDAGNTRFTGYDFKTWTGQTVRFINWDLRESANAGAARDQIIAWCRRWLDPNGDGNPTDGIDGFRLDHVWVKYDKGPEGWGYNLDSFWKPWHEALRRTSPGMFTFAEQADWGSRGGEFLPVFNAALAKPLLLAIREGVKKGQGTGIMREVEATLAALPPDAHARNLTFMAELGDHDMDRFMSVIGDDWGRARAGAAILLTLPFTPMVYMGEEIGMLGVKGDYGSDANDIPLREPFKWAARDEPPMTRYNARHAASWERRHSRDHDGRSVEEQRGVEGSLLEAYRRLIAERRASDALRRGDYAPLPVPEGVYACVRRTPTESAVVLVNLTSESIVVSVDGMSQVGPATLRLGDVELTGDRRVRLGGHAVWIARTPAAP
jgi:alpha-amylase